MSFLDPQPMRGAALLLVHCSNVAEDRQSAHTRLEEQLGTPLTRLLMRALVGDSPQGRRGSSSP